MANTREKRKGGRYRNYEVGRKETDGPACTLWFAGIAASVSSGGPPERCSAPIASQRHSCEAHPATGAHACLSKRDALPKIGYL
ncbi:hypothetical protein PsSCT_44690 [Pseudomonas sp. SCT]